MGRAAFAMALGAALAGVAGCTLLVSFDADPGVELVDPDSGSSTTVPPPPGDAAQAPKDSGGPAILTDGRVPGFPPECKEPAPGFGFCLPGSWTCGKRLSNYPADNKENDVLKCGQDPIYVCVARCPIGCLHVEGFDDQCDPCGGRANGKYCGRDVGWSKFNADVAIVCTAGKATSTTSGCK